VCLDTSIILLFLMIVHTIFGPFLCASNMKLFLPSPIFFAHTRTQFGTTIKSVQCDNGREFDNSQARTFFLSHGVAHRMSCPYTSQQNGKAECSLRTINNIMRSLLFQASLPPVYWVEALYTLTYLVNQLPTKTLAFSTPYTSTPSNPPTTHLRVFRCACYPNMSSMVPHKLAPRSSLCVFLSYSSEYKGYQCLELQSNRILISRHVVFDELFFPFSDMSTTPMDSSAMDFLIDEDDLTTPHPGARLVCAGTSLTVPAALAPHVVHGNVPVHEPVAAPAPAPPSLGPWSPGPTSPDATTIVHPTHATTSSTTSMEPVRAAGTAALVARTQAVASGIGHTAATRSVSVIPVTNVHSMRTHGKANFAQPVDHLNLHVVPMSPLPHSVRDALSDPNWRSAMQAEYDALLANDTWSLVPQPPGVNLVTGKWIYRHKLFADGSLDRYKARWVLRGFTQQSGVDFDETFSLVVKPVTIRVVLSLALSQNWPIH
jgi:hypothetical protein